MTRDLRCERLLLLLTVATSLLLPMSADAYDVLASVRLRGGTITDTTVGAAGEVTAHHADSASVTDAYYTATSGGEVTSDATQGLLDAAVLTRVEIPGSLSRVTPFAEGYVNQADTYRVGAGATGLPTGAAVQIRIQATLVGEVVLHGRPSSSTGVTFNVTGVPGVVGRWVDYYTGGLSPPQDFPIDLSWSTVVDTTVGASFRLDSYLKTSSLGTAFDGPVSDGNHLNARARVRVSAAPGYAGLAITSDAGAPTSPLAALPLSPTLSLLGLGTALTASGVLLAIAAEGLLKHGG